ncbi:hypothetical protein KC333_g547 [Hortaea werneckii]|nr:hypothetical protein KC333_g547 [Hortaea werneckii]KAI7325967.1 hypothetical protein KC326_g470 [Hortaea werneckii]
MANRSAIKDKKLYPHPDLAEYHPEPTILPKAEVLRRGPDDNQQMAAPLVRCGVLKNDPSVVVYIRVQESPTAEVNHAVQFVLAEPTKDEIKFDKHLAFDEKWTGEVGQWRSCADTADQELDAWKQYLIKVIGKNAPESVEIVMTRLTPREESSPAVVGQSTSENTEREEDQEEEEEEEEDEEAEEERTARAQAHFAHIYPHLKTNREVWDAFNMDTADPPFDTEDEDILSKVSLSWVPVISALPDAVRPPNLMLRQALQEVRDCEARQVTLTKTYMTWHGNLVLGSAPEKEYRWGSYEDTIGKVEKISSMKASIGFDIPKNFEMTPELEEGREAIRRMLRRMEGRPL